MYSNIENGSDIHHIQVELVDWYFFIQPYQLNVIVNVIDGALFLPLKPTMEPLSSHWYHW